MQPQIDTDTPAVQRLRHVQVDAASGLHIGTVTIGEQTLRVGIRPGAASRTPLLVFNGIGANLELVVPFLSELAGVETVVFDLPGTGHSPAPKLPYRLFSMARLAARLIDHLGYDQVDALGVSWGGALAQQFALQTPRRVRRLILAATSMGTMLPGRPRVLLKMLSPRRYVDKGYMSRIAPEIYGGDLRTSPQAIKLFTDHARGGDQRGYAFQMLAMWGWSSLPWLWRIRQPTLVLAGRDDPLVPLVNARVHAWLLRNSRLHVIDDGHLFLFTRAHESAQVIGGFLREA
ncbi:MAG TPA: poly(3-hydroxyalkanoate) depolymerase [Albitalea sp.]|nr:poly(3-hydroxyalkanoate) depolymerase [Albitalea sp.]